MTLGEPSTSQMVQALWAKAEIERLMTDLGRALDRCDWELYRCCLTDPIDVNFERSLGFPEIRVGRDLWVRLAEALLAPVKTHHQFSNYAIDLNEGKANAVVYLVARHWRATENGSSEYNQNGWYENRFVQIEGKWKLSRLLHTHQWTTGNAGLFGTPSPEAEKLLKEVFCDENRIEQQ